MRAYAITRYIIWTAVAVVSMGAIVLFTLAQPPTPLAAKLKRASPATVASEAPLAARLPAAAMPSTEMDDDSPQAVELTLPCEGKSTYPRAVAQIRLSGSTCIAAYTKREITSVELLNDANGFSATVFYPTSKTFTTDYVALNEGDNKIKILINYASGEREERSYTIERR